MADSVVTCQTMPPPFHDIQAWANRYPVPGLEPSSFGNVDKNQYYSTVISGKIRLITLNNYISFQPGSPQHTWAVRAFASIDRKVTPWVIVQVNIIYLTYLTFNKLSSILRTNFKGNLVFMCRSIPRHITLIQRIIRRLNVSCPFMVRGSLPSMKVL